MDSKDLIRRYLLGDATNDEIRELDRRLAADSDLRRQLVFEAGNDAGLREIALERMAEPEADTGKVHAPDFRPVLWAIAACAAVLLTIFAVSQGRQPATVATLISNEDAAWESSLPTLPGSRLTAGTLKLKAGMSTLRFASGAELVLEAPAQLELIDPMRARLLAGTAVIEVPEAAQGFVMETPDGYAVDYGTQFAVRVDREGRRSDFELIQGEIAVHHPESGDEVRLTEQGKTASVSRDALVVNRAGAPEPPEEPAADILRLRSRRTGSVRINPGRKPVRREVLIARRNNSGDGNAHSFFAFDLSGIDFNDVESVELRLNQVPSRGGSAARLPKINRFAVHGLVNGTKAGWTPDSDWDTAPQPEDGTLLGKFEIPRSRKRGRCGIGTAALLDHLRTNAGGEATLILSRETKFLIGVGAGKGMTHSFAGDSHPEAVGPTLQFTFKSE